MQPSAVADSAGERLTRLRSLFARQGPRGLGSAFSKTNAVARRLYESKGFVVIDEELGHIDMSKDLEAILLRQPEVASEVERRREHA